MAISKKNKDQRSAVIQKGDGLVLALAQTAISPQSLDPLVFWTNHADRNTRVDLNEFALGVHQRPKGGAWNGPFTGRPQLIIELAPYLRERLQKLSPHTVAHYLNSLRTWWRLFDGLEAQASSPQFTEQVGAMGQSLSVQVRGVADLHPLHEAVARQLGMERVVFNYFKGLADECRESMGLPTLAWVSPEKSEPVRSLPSPEQAKELRHLIKSDWRAVLRNWEKNDAVVAEARRRIAGQPPNHIDDATEGLVRNALYYLEAQHRVGEELLDSEGICGSVSPTTLRGRSLFFSVMRSLMYPTVEQADIAFHMCVLGTAWNPSTVGNLDAGNPNLVRVHPKLVNREILGSGIRCEFREPKGEFAEIQAAKQRAGGALQYAEGMLRNDCSPPAVVRHYLARTVVLREELKRQLDVAAIELTQLAAEGQAHTPQYQEKYLQVQALREGVRCVWLYLTEGGEIKWFTGRRVYQYRQMVECNVNRETYMDRVIDRLNAERERRGKAPIAYVTRSDLRDLFAVWLQKEGGTLSQIMYALGHRSVATTQIYLENNVFHEEADQQILRFQKHLTEQMRGGRIDLTILAQHTRHGSITPEMKARLADYRSLMKSRIGVACESPRTPPVAIAPEHVQGKLCTPQRCAMSCENARFLPESLSGLAMRLEELLVLNLHLPAETWIRGKYEDEMAGVEAVLGLFDKQAVSQALQVWRERIQTGGHLIPEWGIVRTGMTEEVA